MLFKDKNEKIQGLFNHKKFGIQGVFKDPMHFQELFKACTNHVSPKWFCKNNRISLK